MHLKGLSWRKTPHCILLNLLSVSTGGRPSTKDGKRVKDTDADILPGRTRKCNMRSKFRWLTELCNSHYVSQFTAFFIDVRAKTSTAESMWKLRISLRKDLLRSCLKRQPDEITSTAKWRVSLRATMTYKSHPFRTHEMYAMMTTRSVHVDIVLVW